MWTLLSLMLLKKIAYISTYVCNLYVFHQEQAMFTKVRNCYKDYIIVIFLLYYFFSRLLIINHYSSNILSSTKKGRIVFCFAFVFAGYFWVWERTTNRSIGKAWHSLSFQDAISDETWFSLLKTKFDCLYTHATHRNTLILHQRLHYKRWIQNVIPIRKAFEFSL